MRDAAKAAKAAEAINQLLQLRPGTMLYTIRRRTTRRAHNAVLDVLYFDSEGAHSIRDKVAALFNLSVDTRFRGVRTKMSPQELIEAVSFKLHHDAGYFTWKEL
jgi:hypothetical protein